MQAYLTIFALSSSVDGGLRLSMHSNLTEIVELHDELLGDLHRVVPNSEYAGVPPMGSSCASPAMKQRRPQSFDAVTGGKMRDLPLFEFSGMTADPQTAAAVANVFSKVRYIFFCSQAPHKGANKSRRAASSYTKNMGQNTEWCSMISEKPIAQPDTGTGIKEDSNLWHPA